MKTYKELVCELCEYFGFDDLFPYTDTEKIEQRFKEQFESIYEKLLTVNKAQAENRALIAQLKTKIENKINK